MRHLTVGAALAAILGLACTDRPAPVAVDAPTAHEATASLGACNPDLAMHIRNQIDQLFPKGKSLRQAAQSQFANIVRACPGDEAQQKARDFVAFTLAKHQNRQLTRAATPTAVAVFLTDVLAYVELASAGVVTVVQPSTSVQTVTTTDGQAGAVFPPGAVSQPVVVSIAPSADQTDPLPTGFAQFPPFYDFVASPAVEFAQPVTIGICVTVGSVAPEVLERLRLARPDAATGGATIEVLPFAAAPFLDCPPLPDVASAAVPGGRPGFFDRLLTAGAALVRPAVLHAAGLRLTQVEVIGLGGTVVKFGDNPVGTVNDVCAGLEGVILQHCSALVALYNATDGPNWTNHANWLETADICTWYGVNCVSGVVPRELLLGHNNLTGTLPLELGNLDSLRLLHLYENHLSGPIPAVLDRMSELRELLANHNRLSDAIPAELGSLSQLRFLFLNANQLGGQIPEALGNLSQLEVLALNENQLSGTIPATLGDLGSLQHLRLQLNQLTGLVPLAVAQLGGLLEAQDPVSCSLTPGNALFMGDSPDYRAADLDGDGLICGVAVPQRFTSLGAGYSHTCGLTSAGTVFCWGFNQSGRLGDGTTTSHSTPAAVQMPDGVTFASLSVGAGFTCGLAASGAAYCWGENFYGQVGDGTTIDRSTPVAVVMPDGVTFVALSAFGAHTCGLTVAGAAYCWGYNFHGQLGDGSTDDRTTPVAVLMPPAVTSFLTIRAGEAHTCGVTGTKEAYCWGENGLGQLGNGTTANQLTPVAVAGPLQLGVRDSLTAGGAHSCGLNESVGGYCWGWNTSGQLGDETTTNQLTPVRIATPTGQRLVGVNAGGVHTCGLTDLGAAYCWGDNRDGQVGDGTTTNTSTPVAVHMPVGVTFTSLSLSAYHSCGLTPAGRAYCWGDNWSGQLGDGTATDRSIPTPVAP